MRRNHQNHHFVDVLLAEFHQFLLLLLVLEEDQGNLQPQPQL